MNKLVIVESPAKARTIGKILGAQYAMFASMGHIIDLPRSRLGVAVEADFAPTYVAIAKKKQVIADLKKKARHADTVYLATDPDREGEAISWHVRDHVLKDRGADCYKRVVFHEITPQAIKAAFANPQPLNIHKVDAQQARRVLDRIVGYHLSPLLWKKIAKGLSAGRVQSVALRLLVEREREIQRFVAQEYWRVHVTLKRRQPAFEELIAELLKRDGEKLPLTQEAQALAIVEELRAQEFVVQRAAAREKSRRPAPPFITSTLQQDAFNKLRFAAAKTMMIAQQLYEGVEWGAEGPLGLITYMRTDSVTLSQPAITEIRDYIRRRWNDEYVPQTPQRYKSRRGAQEAHEAIRPTAVSRDPESARQFLSAEQYALYDLIWKRAVASQMSAARYLQRTVEIGAGRYTLHAAGSTVLFDGFLTLYRDDDAAADPVLPELIIGEPLSALAFNPTQHFTRPPPRYTEASLVKALEEDGIGRPSTYAPIIQTLTARNYIRREKSFLHATELGMNVCDILVQYFPRVMNVQFTATMEEQLDKVEDGAQDWVALVREFYQPFKERLDYAQANIQKQVIESGHLCERCGKPMLIRWSAKGKFLGCAGFPECRNAKPLTSGVKCPQPGCAGELVQRRSKRGMRFYGCTRYPDCCYVSRTLPDTAAATSPETSRADPGSAAA